MSTKLIQVRVTIFATFFYQHELFHIGATGGPPMATTKCAMATAVATGGAAKGRAVATGGLRWVVSTGMLQQQNFSIGRVKTLMSAMRDENQILNYLDLEEKKRAIEERSESNEKLRSDSIAKGKDANEDDYIAACQELLQNSSGIKTKIETPLKSGDEGAILRSPEDAEQRLAEARATRQQRNPVKMVPHHKKNRNQGTSKKNLMLTTQMKGKSQEM